MDSAKFRSWVASRQGLGNGRFCTAREALVGAGWQRSVGGVHPYIAIRARSGEGREQVDALAVDLQLFELPSARSCTYVLPADDFRLGLAAAHSLSAATEIATAFKLGATQEEIDILKRATLAALAKGDLSPADLKPKLGDLVRNFGEEGKKKGLTTSLPLALALLQTEGRIRRRPVNGRFDTQRYNYELWNPPLTDLPGPEQTARDLTLRFFDWMGAATLKEFREFSAIPAKAAKAAAEEIGLIPFEAGGDLLTTSENLADFEKHEIPQQSVYALIGSLDSFLLQRRGSHFWLDDEDLNRSAPTEKGIQSIGGLMELTANAILDRGRLIGIWEFDFDAGEVVWHTWNPASEELRAKIDSLNSWIRDDLGDARTFSLDSPKSRQPKIEAIRAMTKL